MDLELDVDLLASIASGGLGSWIEDKQGNPTYLKHDDCLRKYTIQT